MSPKRRNTIDVLERRKAMIDALITFMKKHPKTAADARVKGLDGGKNGLSFPDYALIVPYWNGGDIQLRLLRSGEDWTINRDPKAEDRVDYLVSQDVSVASNEELEKMLDGMWREANPDEADEEDDSDSN